MGDWHFSNWVRLVVFTFDRITEFTIYELRFTNEESRKAGRQCPGCKNETFPLRMIRVRRATPCVLNSKLSTINWLLITREYARSDLKENGTIPF
jgi:hypothetical protein